MKSFNTYYTDKEALGSFIANKKIANTPSLLIQVFSASTDENFINNLLSELTFFLPDAVIIGTTTDGEIMEGKVTTGKVVLSFTLFEHTLLKASAVEHRDNGYESGRYLAKKLIGSDTKLMIAFVDGLYTNGEEFLKGIDSINDKVIVAGGYAADNNAFVQTLVFTKDKVLKKGAVAVTLDSTHLHVYKDYSFNWQPIGNELTITKAEGNRIYTIDGKSAVDIYSYYLGKNIADGLPGIGVEFPLIVNRNGSNIARASIGKMDDGSLIVGGNVYTGEKVRIGFGDAKAILKRSREILKRTAQKPSEVIFIYTCSTRKYFMGSEVEEETLPLAQIGPVSGFFTYGEFFTSEDKELFNQTMTLVSLSESEYAISVLPDTHLNDEDIRTVSIEALTHLVKISSRELEERAKSLEKSNREKAQLKERMELALLGSNNGVWDWNILDNSVYFSPRWKEMLGYKDDELSNTVSSWAENIHPDDSDRTWEDIYKNVNGETEYYENIHRLRHKNGHWVWILDRGKTLYDENGRAVRMIGTHTDITQEKHLQLQFAQQAQVIGQIYDSVTTTDMQGNITSWNPGSEKIFGYKAEEVIGKNISILYRSEDIPQLLNYIEILKEKGVHNDTALLVSKSNKFIPISFTLSLLRDEQGKPVGIVGINKDDSQRKKAEKMLQEQKDILHHQAYHDTLTGLPNRLFFFKRLEEGLKRHKKGLGILFIDLDKFKHINDSLGHEIGDRVLKLIAKRLRSIIRENDTLARLSGDEFTIIMEDLTEAKNASVLAEKILRTLAEPIKKIDGHTLYISGSIGISLFPQDSTDAKNLLKYADTAMYQAKEEGSNTFKFYSQEMTVFALERIAMKTRLREAIDNKEFIIHYQPQVNSANNTLVGMEALVRWKHPTMGLLPPEKFLPLAEETGLVTKIDQWVMETAMKQIAAWYKLGLNPGILALNLSVKQLEKENFLHVVTENIRQYDFYPKWLELEITEGHMLTKAEEVIEKLDQLHELGIGISIDDFGTGYSSLSLLKRLPINRLKIDRSFIMNIPTDEDDITIVKAILALAKNLKLDVIAEGVELQQQKDFLVENGCANIQGYYFSQPISANEMKSILIKEKSQLLSSK